MELIDLDHWPRRAQFEHFSSLSDPFYNVTFTQDVTGLYRYVKAHGLSFYYSLVYLATRAVNEVEAFRCDIQDGRVVLLDERAPSFTDLKPGSDAFHIVTMPCRGTMAEFCAEARRRSAEQDCFLNQAAESRSLIYFSCLPWVELTALTNEGLTDPDDSIPRIAWGKYRDEGGRKTLGLSLELNHRFVDGVHIGKFAAALTRMINEL
ncbi:MAG: CatA-like O-acetyltransferase [Candidatus Enterenecus sp.]